MKNSTVLLGWTLYVLSWYFSSLGLGFVAGFIARIIGLPETFTMPVSVIIVLTTNFFAYKWSVSKIVDNY